MTDAFALAPTYPIYLRRMEHADIVGLYRSPSYPNLIVIDKKNGGKADALNAGLNLANGDLVCAIDADTIIERDALRRLVRPFIRSNNVLAAGGTIRIANGSEIANGRVVQVRVPRNPLAGFQTGSAGTSSSPARSASSAATPSSEQAAIFTTQSVKTWSWWSGFAATATRRRPPRASISSPIRSHGRRHRKVCACWADSAIDGIAVSPRRSSLTGKCS